MNLESTQRAEDGAAEELFTRWRDDGAEMDCETAMLLRAHLAPLFQEAESWEALRAALSERGLKLAIRGGGLAVIGATSGRAICTASFLGVPLSALAARLGRPSVVALPGSDAAGEFLN